jgi:hypothetical protein
MIRWDSAIIAREFCGTIDSVWSYKSTVALIIIQDDDTVMTAFAAYPDVRQRGQKRYLFTSLGSGDSLCKDSGSEFVRSKSRGAWKDWEIMTP